MCVGFWSLDHPDYALILCTNRDEHLSRPTATAHFHSFERGPDDPHPQQGPFVLSGRDLKAGGSWFGINRAGRVALLTNITEPHHEYRLSRGRLVSSFLLPGAPHLEQFAHDFSTASTSREGPSLSPNSSSSPATTSSSSSFAGFNLLALEPKYDDTPGSPGQTLSYNAALITNHGGGGEITYRTLSLAERHLGGVSNGVDSADGGRWPKVLKGQDMLTQLLADETVTSSEETLTERLFELLTWTATEPPANRSQLRNSILIPPLRMTPDLAADAKADGPDYYGTRLSTVLLVRRDGQVRFVERDVWQLDAATKAGVTRGDPRLDRVFNFKLESTEKPSDSA